MTLASPALAPMLPSDLGLPHAAWRPGQWEFINQIADAYPDWIPGQTKVTSHQMLIAPTGFGKSLTYMGIAALTGWTVGILTATKSLQDQLQREFEAIGAVDVRGRAAYPCNAATNAAAGLFQMFCRGREYTCAAGPCRLHVRCSLKDGGCNYFDTVRAAIRGQIFVTNYDFWMRNRWRWQEAQRPVDLLVMDEAHLAPQELEDFLSFRLKPDIKAHFRGRFPQSPVVAEWQEWSGWAAEVLAKEIERAGPDVKLIELERDLSRMHDFLTEGEWVIEKQTGGDWHFDCIDSDKMGRRHLWGQSRRTLLVSATVNNMTANALGIPTPIKVWEAKSAFPIARRPVYAVNGAVRLNFRSMEGEKRMWVNLIDRIIDSRKDRKGIIHTTSFERAKYLLQHTRHKDLMILNESRNTALTVASFKKAKTGVLVSPSLTTGWDFPFTECEYQIIGKIPFPDLRSLAAKAKAKRNKEWSGYTAAQVIVQASGRGMRSESDQCETFIVDGNFGWWYWDNRKFTPKWWQAAVQTVELSKLPAPPPRLEVTK